MDIKEFAEKYRLRIKSNGVENLIHGKFGEAAQQREEREAEALRLLNKKVSEQAGEDVVAEMCASVIRVQRID